MPKWIMLGRRKNDTAIMYDLDRFPSRGIVRGDTKWVQGTPLEEIPFGKNDHAPAMILVHRNWDDLYFVNQRADWTDDRYFEFAAQRFKELGIEKP